jgi:molybdopterin-guanine dinucleotide biosynthesis protein A
MCPDSRPNAGPLIAGILVGGASLRMGRPKQLISYDGLTLAERVALALRAAAEQIVLLGAGPVAPSLESLERIDDVPDLRGPLAGILAALRWAPASPWIIVACDMPLVSAEAVRWLVDQRSPGKIAVLPIVAGGRVEPLLAVYEPDSRPMLEALVRDGALAPARLAADPRVATPQVPSTLVRAWVNANSPDELPE